MNWPEVQVFKNLTIYKANFNQINIPISSLIWTSITTSNSFKMNFSFVGTDTPSWIYVDPMISAIVGSSDKMDVKYNVLFTFKVYGSVIQRTLVLSIPKWPMAHWLLWISSVVWTSCESSYQLVEDKWIESSDQKTVESMKSAANTLGTAAQVVNAALVAGTLGAASLSPMISVQIVFWVAGYYQMLMTLLVLRYILPDNLK